MAQDVSNTAELSWWRAWLSFDFYKRSQGRYARYGTFFALALGVTYGSFSLLNALIESAPGVRYAWSGAMLLGGVWFCVRLIQWPRFADFLIGVEAEMNKVSWPARSELYRSVIVVLAMLGGMTVVIALFDVMWNLLLGTLGIIGPGGG